MKEPFLDNAVNELLYTMPHSTLLVLPSRYSVFSVVTPQEVQDIATLLRNEWIWYEHSSVEKEGLSRFDISFTWPLGLA